MSCPWLQHFIGKMATISQSIPWFSPWFTGLPWHSPFQKLKFPSMLIKQCLKNTRRNGNRARKNTLFKKMILALWRNTNFVFQNLPNHGFQNFGVSAFYPSNRSFSSEGFRGVEKKKNIYIYIYFRQKRRFKASIVFFLQVGTAVYVPPLPKKLCTTANRGLRRTNFWECNSLMQTMWHQYTHQ